MHRVTSVRRRPFPRVGSAPRGESKNRIESQSRAGVVKYWRVSFLQIVHALAPQAAGGVELYALEVAQALGGAVLSLTPLAGEAPPDWQGFQVETRSPGEAPEDALRRVLDSLQPQAVLVQHLGGASPEALKLLRERRIPYAVFLHDYTQLCPTHRLWRRGDVLCSGPGAVKCAFCVCGEWRRAIEIPWRVVLYQHRPELWEQALGGAEMLIAASRSLRDLWAERGAPPERILVVAPRLPRPAPPSRSENPVPRRNAVVYVGGWGEAKGAVLLAQALDQVPGPLTLEVAGAVDAAARVAFRAAVAERHAVEFHGVLARAQLDALLARSAVAVMPSRWEEAYGRFLDEAQEAGASAVATAVGAFPERLIHGLNGYLAVPDDPGSLATALREATPGRWDHERTAQHHAAEREGSLRLLRGVLEHLQRGERRPPLDLVLPGVAAAMAQVTGCSQVQAEDQVVDALRAPVEGGLAPVYTILSRQRRLHLNQALALFHAAGCRSVLEIHPGLGDATAYFTGWGVTTMAENEASGEGDALRDALGVTCPTPESRPDALWCNAGTIPEQIQLRLRRYPSIRVVVQETADGAELVSG